ncbi:MAG: chitobiase/beta-hexosaminidase C-terminal domain-containing protein [Alloprevotella sp.]|nr:chitobiase/beta-hexosaminidase C-terminal domain-containing protein [Alloprevotella sp.]
MYKQLLNSLRLRSCMLVALLCTLSMSAWGENFSQTYSFGQDTWSRTNFSTESDYYKSSSNKACVAAISGIFTGKTITGDVKITLNVATYGSGTNPTSTKFSVYTSAACSTQVTAAQSGTLPSSSTYVNTIYTVTQANATALFSHDLAIEVATAGRVIRLKSIKVEFTYTPIVTKSPIGTFSNISDVSIPFNDGVEFDPSDYFTKATGATGDVSFSVTPTSGDIYYKDGYLCATAAGSQEFTITATPAAADATNYEEVTKKFTAICTDNRTEIGSITAISPTTVYVGQTGEFTLTESYTEAVSSKTWSLGSGEDAYLELADEMFEGLSSGNVNVSITATPTDAATYKPVTATFPVSVEYKYAAPTLPTASAFFTTKSISIPAIDGADIFYTLDGTTPTKTSSKYTSAIEVSETKTVKAIAIDADGLVSPVASVTYTKETVFDINGSDIEFDATKIEFEDEVTGYNNGVARKGTISNSDGTKTLNVTGAWIMKNSGIQFQNSGGVMTTQWIQNGSKALSITPTFTNGLTYKITYADGTSTNAIPATTNQAIVPTSFPCQITLQQNSGTPKLTKLTLTALKDPIATDVSITDPGTLAKGATGTFSGSSTDAAECTKSWTSSDASVIEITNAATGAYTTTGRGTAKITYTVTPSDATNYRAVTAERNISVTAPVVITAGDVNIAYGASATAIEASTSTGYAGSLAYESSNTDVVTVNANGYITPVAVGTATITISAPADAANLYTAGEDKEVTVTVSAPEGKTTVQKGTTTSTATLDFTDNTVWNLPTDYEKSKKTYSNGTYSITLEGGTSGDGYKFGVYNEETSLILGKKDATFTFQAFEKFLTQIDITGRDGASGKVTQNIFVGDVPVSTGTTGATGTNSYIIASDYQAPGNIYTLKVTNGNNTQFTKIVLHFADARTEDVTLNASGYATFCSEGPLDFSDYETADFSAWQITSIEGEVITFEQITSAVKGGTGVLLKGKANSTVTINSANSETTLSGNKLVGTLAPTYFDTDAIYGLAGNTFMHNNAGTFKANKAYIPASVIDDAGSDATRAFTFVFVDPTTGITETQNVSAEEFGAIFNLAGQRISQPQKGVNIINGKKVLVK